MKKIANKARFLQYWALSICCAFSFNSSNVFIVRVSPIPALSLRQEQASVAAGKKPSFAEPLPMSRELWQYLRAGLNYLETSGNKYPPEYRHPGNVAYGALGLTENAVQDVKQRYKSMARYSLKEVFSQEEVYEAFARLYADLLLRHYLAMRYESVPAPEVFMRLQKAWFLGPTLYKKGGEVIASRQRKTQAFTSRIGFPLNFQAQASLTRLP